MNYKDALQYIYSFTNYEKIGMPALSPVTYNLERMASFLTKLGSPQNNFPSIVIAGTKGKGSTAALSASAIGFAGYKVGLYSQPHLHTFRERFRINNKLIDEDRVIQLVEHVLQPAIDSFHKEKPDLGHLTTYEIGTALALLHFATAKIDFAVLEIGLGGRLDAVNVVTPLVSAIASISYDHMQVLGNTLTQIATEKAGIIKPDGKTITADQSPEAMQVIEKTCAERHSSLYKVGKDIWAEPLPWAEPLSLAKRRREFQHIEIHWGSRLGSNSTTLSLELPLLGPHQLENAALAAGILSLLNMQGIKVDMQAIKSGFEQVQWSGRLEVLSDEPGQPLIVADGAHNADSARRLMQALAQNFLFENLIMVVGAANDKDIEGIFRELQAIEEGLAPPIFILTRANNARAASPQTLLERGHFANNAEVILSPDVADSIENARKLAGPKDLICFTGSLFIVSDVRKSMGLTVTTDPL